MSPFWTQKHDFEVPLESFFHRFGEYAKIRKSFCFSILFIGLGPSKTIDFPIISSLIFYVFSKPPLGTVFRASQCRSLLKSWILVPCSIFGIFKKTPFGRPFPCQSRLFVTGVARRSVLVATLLFTKP